MSAIDPMFYIGMYIVSYTLAWYTWKDEEGWFSRIMKFLLTGLIPIVSLMLFIWKIYKNPEEG
jgi:uncharacterized membrane protein YfhO